LLNEFGLGLVLEFTDKASVGLHHATEAVSGLANAVDSLESGSNNLKSFTNAFLGVGVLLTATLTVPIVKFTQSLIKAGTTRASFVQDANLGFTALLGTMQEASSYMDKLLDFARTTPFNFMTLAASARNMVTYGFEATKVLGMLKDIGDFAGGSGLGESAVSGLSQLLSIIKSTGRVDGRRLISLGQYGINAPKIIGNIIGATDEMEARMAIASMTADDFVDKLLQGLREGTDGIMGLTPAYEGTMGKLRHTWTGALDRFRGAFQRAGLELLGQYTDETGTMRFSNLEKLTAALNNITDALGQVAGLVRPMISWLFPFAEKVSRVVKKVMMWFTNLDAISQRIVSSFAMFMTFIGPILTFFGGVVPKAVAFLGIKISLLGILKATLKTFGLLILKFAPFIAMAALAYQVWDKNIGGIRDSITNMFKDVGTVLSLVAESFSGNALSEDSFKKANELGLLPFIESMLDLKYLSGFFKEGFILGFKEFLTQLDGILTKFGLLDVHIFGMSQSIGEFIKGFTGIDDAEESWREFGRIIGKLAGWVPTLLIIVKVVTIIFKIFSKIGGIGKLLFAPTGALAKTVGVVSTLFGYIKGMFVAISSFLTSSAFLGVLSTLSIIAAGLAPLIFWKKDVGNKDEGYWDDSKKEWIVPQNNDAPEKKNFFKEWWDNRKGASTGGYTRKGGLEKVHANELIVNDPLTQKLKTFLDREGGGNYSQDNKIIFGKESVIINVKSASEEEVEKIADKLIRIIERKQALRKIAQRRYA
jgi:hypothetical protein